MITRFEDYLRRRTSIALLVARDELAASAGLRDACRMLFGPEAERRHDEYFGDHQQQTDRGAATGGPEGARRVEG
jgi:glycerol-3-phosphate dehydrogenase